MTGLLKVKDWGWHLYHAKFSYTENGPVIHEDDFITSTNDEDRCCQERGNELFGQLSEGWWYQWELIEQSVESRLRFVPGLIGGTSVEGAGWKAKGWRN